MNTDKKFTVALSAFRTDASTEENYINTEMLAGWLSENARGDVLRAVGVYNSQPELSFVVHTNSNNVVFQLLYYALNTLGQECALVSNNYKEVITLHYFDSMATIGKRFNKFASVPKNTRDYTFVGGNYYTVQG
jgi:hypothetical protein